MFDDSLNSFTSWCNLCIYELQIIYQHQVWIQYQIQNFHYYCHCCAILYWWIFIWIIAEIYITCGIIGVSIRIFYVNTIIRTIWANWCWWWCIVVDYFWLKLVAVYNCYCSYCCYHNIIKITTIATIAILNKP